MHPLCGWRCFGRNNWDMEIWVILRHRPLCPLHGDVFFHQRFCVSIRIISTRFLYLEKNGVFRKGRNFHISRFPHEMLEPVKCTQFYPSRIHMFIEVILKRKIGVFFDARDHTLNLYRHLKGWQCPMSLWWSFSDCSVVIAVNCLRCDISWTYASTGIRTNTDFENIYAGTTH